MCCRWTPSQESFELELIESVGEIGPKPVKDKTRTVIILALARCPCALRTGWLTFKIPKATQAKLFEFYSSSSSSDVEGIDELPYFERQKIAWFTDCADEAKAKVDKKKKVRNNGSTTFHKSNFCNFLTS